MGKITRNKIGNFIKVGNYIEKFIDKLLYSSQPKVGNYIVITWLPPKNSCFSDRFVRNAYIGYCGKVTELYNGGGFVCFNGSSKLCITNKKFRYKIVYTVEQVNLEFNF